MSVRGLVLVCLAGLLAFGAPVQAQTMKTMIAGFDFEGLPFAPNHPTGWGNTDAGEVLFAGQPCNMWYWGGQVRVVDTSLAHGGRKCWRGYGLEWGMGMIVLTDPLTQPSTKYQAEFWIKDECPVDGRMYLEFAENDVGGKGSGEVRRSWPTTWIKDSISWTTPASIAKFNALMLNIATLGVGQGMATTQSYGYIDDIIICKVGPVASVPPNIVYQPVAATTDMGKTAVFSVGPTGAMPLTYQWYKNGAPIAGATDRTYLVRNAGNADHNARFKVKITNKDGEITSREVTLTVNGAVGAADAAAQIRACAVGTAVLRSGSAWMALPEAGAWTMELRALDGRLVGLTSGRGDVARIALPAAGTACAVRVTCGDRTFVSALMPAAR